MATVTPVETTLLILGLAVVAFMTGRIPIAIVAVGVSVLLWFTGVLELNEALAGFGDPTVVFIAALFVVSDALDATGVTAWAGQQAISRGGTKRTGLLLTICLLVALLTALISVNGAVAALIPVVVVVAVRVGLPPSQMLMPLAFSAHAGSMLALTGTPVNIIVSDAAENGGGRAFGFFEYAAVGIPLLIGTLVIILAFGRKLLPHNQPTELPADVAVLARALRRDYQLPANSELMGATRGVTEVVIPPRSELVGTHLFPGQATPSGDLVVLAVQRAGEPITSRDSVLAVGDTLLLGGTWEDLELHTSGPEVLVVNDPASLRRGIPMGKGAKRSLVILGAMILLLVTGWMPPAIAALLAAGAVILSGVFTPARAYKAVSWTTVLLVAGMIPLSTAFIKTGTADLIADMLLTYLGDSPAQIALLTLCVLTMVLGQMISNTATVLIMAPIAVALSVEMDVSVMPFMMALAVSGAASFLTPVATPANTMVMEPGAYKFGDYWKLGFPLLLLFLAVAVLWVPVVWPF